MDGVDISAMDQIDDRILRCQKNQTFHNDYNHRDDDDDETYQSAVSHCDELAGDSAVSDHEFDPELQHRTKRLKTVDEKQKVTPEVGEQVSASKQILNQQCTPVPDSQCTGHASEQESKSSHDTSAKESQKTQQSDDSMYGSRNDSSKLHALSKADDLRSSQSPQVVNIKSQDQVNQSKSPQSLYERFIQSNSVSLSKSPKFEALQCPYCVHGFVNFSALETHVIFCKKRKK